ncbi:FAD-dependent oxidoreductase [Sphingomonas sp.]|uniref:FAD-dependent oxidoreductase n=1 Tax=Sphingomonas sp. TaxID=28214 RepID=UPI002DD646F6|nr:FAD-dependent oxidoreductase [Sphingomonas sp.]
MTHVVTQSCCNDASCVTVCPVNCIHPTPDEAGYATAEMLFIDPAACIDCGACLDICPVGAIDADYDLTEENDAFRDLAARFFQGPTAPAYVPRRADRPLSRASQGAGALRVAVIGSGPAGAFATEYLLDSGADVTIDLFERLPVPWGLTRFGVAPDHPRTKQIADIFERIADDPRCRLVLGVEIGRDIALSELEATYDAVIVATGALADRALGIPGEDLRGSHSATEFAGWYNGHPDFADRRFNLDTERAVVIGNGNVALDVARVLASDVDALRHTDIADHALDALAASRVREVVVVGRRGPADAAFTAPELLGLAASRAFSLRVDLPADTAAPLLSGQGPQGWAGAEKAGILHRLARQAPLPGRPLRLVFQRSPVELIGEQTVSAVRFARNRIEVGPDGRAAAVATGEQDLFEAGLVLRSIGYAGSAIAGMPFNDRTRTVPSAGGRVIDPATGDARPKLYVAGWIRRGPSGSMGSNRACARETVAALLDDHRAGRLAAGGPMPESLAATITRSAGLADWRSIDRHERAQGRLAGRPRVKLVDRHAMARIGAQGTPR